MSVEVKGVEALERRLQQKFGEANMQRIVDGALKKGAEYFLAELKKELSTFSGIPGTTGATLEEATVTEPYTKAGVRMVSVHWKGPNRRYSIIHLNEYGTIKNPNPKGKGAIARALKNAEAKYRDIVKNAIEEGVKA